jgi:FKBP-type peptidyl-prolyl cis-trans isomerase
MNESTKDNLLKIGSTIIALAVLFVLGAYFINKKANTPPAGMNSQGTINVDTSQMQGGGQQAQQQDSSSLTMGQEQGQAQGQEQSAQQIPNDGKLHAQTIQEGTGEGAKAGDKVEVNYVGMLTDGTKFDSSYDRGTPFSFNLGAGQVIQGWDQGVEGMKVGEKRELVIPPDLGYGAQGTGSIPPNATLVFQVEMMKIN